MPAVLVTVPDDVTDFLLPDNFVRKAKFGRPDFTKNHATNSGFNDLLLRITKDRFRAIIRILQQNPLMDSTPSIFQRKNDFFLTTKEF